MNRATRAVVDFLNNLRREEINSEEGKQEEMPLLDVVNKAEKVSVATLLTSRLSQNDIHEKFTAPPLQQRTKEKLRLINSKLHPIKRARRRHLSWGALPLIIIMKWKSGAEGVKF